jgi:RNA polymerase sigma-70 factor, ECF subfamily
VVAASIISEEARGGAAPSPLSPEAPAPAAGNGPGRSAARSFERQFAPLLGPAYGTALHMTRHKDDAEDLVQEAVVRAFRSFHTFEEGTNFKAWFFRILTNLYLNKYRQKQRQPEIVDLEDAPDLYLYSQTRREGWNSQTEDPAGQVMRKLDTEQVAAAIDALPEEYRTVCALYFMEEFAYQEIAEILDCPIGTVRSRLHRGRKLLQRALWHLVEEQRVLVEGGICSRMGSASAT